MQNPVMWLVDGLNTIRINVWSIGLIGIGSLLVLHGKGDVGGSLVTGGFALLRHDTAPPPNTVPDPKAH